MDMVRKNYNFILTEDPRPTKIRRSAEANAYDKLRTKELINNGKFLPKRNYRDDITQQLILEKVGKDATIAITIDYRTRKIVSFDNPNVQVGWGILTNTIITPEGAENIVLPNRELTVIEFYDVSWHFNRAFAVITGSENKKEIGEEYAQFNPNADAKDTTGQPIKAPGAMIGFRNQKEGDKPIILYTVKNHVYKISNWKTGEIPKTARYTVEPENNTAVTEPVAEVSETAAPTTSPAAVIANISTVLGKNGQPVHGVTVDAQNFNNLQEAEDLNARTLRMYFPPSSKFVEGLANSGKFDTLFIGIPLNKQGYDANGLNSYFGQAVPQGRNRINLEDGNFVPYEKEILRIAGDKVKVYFEYTNEANQDNHYPVWTNQQQNKAAAIQQLFAKVKGWTQTTYREAGPDVNVAIVLGDKADLVNDIVSAIQTGVKSIGFNWYRPEIAPLIDMIKKAQAKTGIYTTSFYIAEAGPSSVNGEEAQARAVLHIWQDAQKMNMGVIFMSLKDNPRKSQAGSAASSAEALWGWEDRNGKPKAAFEEIKKIWSQEPHSFNQMPSINANHPRDGPDGFGFTPVASTLLPRHYFLGTTSTILILPYSS